ncbi:hypothetical protein [Nonomuraea wenchangensis]|uniref:Lipoprotein n=1 Tax=Nonomuraea wenchangensis TaxID=568860 RepID=A0A1I0GBM8_9ACTN|nr:hypothetical protein [Nonomuraea wenchangensis]SET67511.1 hypothetical protein SAMN05421811_103812 [Nonomuraea wenchangensis]
MRRPAAALLALALSGCALSGCAGGGGSGSGEAPVPRTSAEVLSAETPSADSPSADSLGDEQGGNRALALSCDAASEVHLPAVPAPLRRAGAFSRLPALTRPLDVHGLIWSQNDERLYVGVVCGPRTAEQFVTLVAQARLTMWEGRPALHWTTRTGVRNFMWLERPGVAVYVGATPGLSDRIHPIATGIG